MKKENEDFQKIIDEVMKQSIFEDMASIVGKEITQHAALLSVLQAELDESLNAFPTFKEQMKELEARRIVFKGKLSNIETPTSKLIV